MSGRVRCSHFDPSMTWDGFLRSDAPSGARPLCRTGARRKQLWSAATSTQDLPCIGTTTTSFLRSWEMVSGRDLYAWHPEEHWDLFKYTPTFAVLILPHVSLRCGLSSCYSHPPTSAGAGVGHLRRGMHDVTCRTPRNGLVVVARVGRIGGQGFNTALCLAECVHGLALWDWPCL